MSYNLFSIFQLTLSFYEKRIFCFVEYKGNQKTTICMERILITTTVLRVVESNVIRGIQGEKGEWLNTLLSL